MVPWVSLPDFFYTNASEIKFSLIQYYLTVYQVQVLALIVIGKSITHLNQYYWSTFPLKIIHSSKQKSQKKKGKQNPNNVMLYLYTTYDSNSFDPLCITSCPMILVQPRGFCVGDDFQSSVGVNLQILEFPFLKIKLSCRRRWSLSKALID